MTLRMLPELDPVDRARAFHVVNLSLPKTGSASLARMFSDFRSWHELDHVASVEALLDWREGCSSTEDLDAYLVARDARAQPELDSATFLHLAAARLPDLFPEARFVIVLRPGGHWSASFLGMLMDMLRPGGWGQRELPDGWVTRYAAHVAPALAEIDLRSQVSILAVAPALVTELASYWGARTAAALTAAPPERTLVIDLASLGLAAPALSALVGMPAGSVADGIWANRGGVSERAHALLGRRRLDAAFAPWNEHVQTVLAETGHRVWTAEGSAG